MTLYDIALTVFVITSSLVMIIIIKNLYLVKLQLEKNRSSDVIILSKRIDELERKVTSLTTKVNSISKIDKELRKAEIKELIGNRVDYTEETSEVTKTSRSVETPTSSGVNLSKGEKEVIKVLIELGEASSTEISSRIGKSREHVSRILKSLYMKGYLERIETSKPFRYRIKQESIETIKRVL